MVTFIIICVLIAFIRPNKVKGSYCFLCENTILSISLNQPRVCTKYNENRSVFITCEKIKSTFQEKYQIDYTLGGQSEKTTPQMLNNICIKMGYCEKSKGLDTPTEEHDIAIAKEMIEEAQKTVKKITKKMKKMSKMHEKLDSLTRRKRYVTPSLSNELPKEKDIYSFCDDYDRIIQNKIIELNWMKNKLTQTTKEPKIRDEKKIEYNTLLEEIDSAISSLNSIRFQISELMRKSN